jgi:hypothetical protein
MVNEKRNEGGNGLSVIHEATSILITHTISHRAIIFNCQIDEKMYFCNQVLSVASS